MKQVGLNNNVHTKVVGMCVLRNLQRSAVVIIYKSHNTRYVKSYLKICKNVNFRVIRLVKCTKKM